MIINGIYVTVYILPNINYAVEQCALSSQGEIEVSSWVDAKTNILARVNVFVS